MAFATRLCEKIVNNRHQLAIATDGDNTGEQLSQQLWQSRPDSFLAHSIVAAESQQQDPILICQTTPPAHCHDVLMNLSNSLLEHCFSRFNRVVEIVVQDEEILHQTRQAHKFYASRQYPIRIHNI